MKKNSHAKLRMPVRYYLKWLFMFKLTIFFLTAFSVNLFANETKAQGTVSLRYHQTTLKKLLLSIQEQTDVAFIYNDNLIKGVHVSNIAADNKSWQAVLFPILEKSGLTVDFVTQNRVVIRKQEQHQELVASGIVVDRNGVPIPSVSVTEKGTTRGTSSDNKGYFSLLVSSDKAILEFTGIGYLRQEVSFEQGAMTVVLQEDLREMDEVVVVGYGTQRKENLTGAVTSVNFEERVGNRSINTIGTALQGAAPGLQVTRTTGEPGGGFSMNIRGTTSINGGSPLILVDNVPFEGGLNLIDPNDIASVSILKDAASASIYGARSAYGVILVTTKTGRRNTPVNINYHNNLTFNTAPFLPEKASPLETVQAYKDAGGINYFSGQNIDKWLDFLAQYNQNPTLFPEGYALDGGTRYYVKPTNEMEDFISHTGFQNNHNLAVSGGSESTVYRLSFGTTDEDGIIVTNKDRYKRYNLKSFVSTDIKPWLNVSLDLLYNNSNRTMPNADVWFQAATSPSYRPLGNLSIDGETLPTGTGANLVRLGATDKTQLSNFRTTGKIVVTPIEKLRINGEYTFDKLNGLYDNYDKRVRYINTNTFIAEFNRNSSQFEKYNQTTNYRALNIYGDYKEQLGNHGIKALLGFNQEERYYEQQYSIISQMINDDLPSLSQATGDQRTNDSYDEYALRGFFGRINYDYMGRYLLEINGRYDGSSKFPPNNRWGFFPSASIGWRVIDESFMQSARPWLSELKLRASYGTVGNQAINTYVFVPAMDSYRANWLENNGTPLTLNAPSLVSNNFTWETVESQNVGVDFGLLSNKLTGSFDVYTRYTKNMLASGEELPAVLGAVAPLKNVADLKSSGFELELNWKDKIGAVNYSLGGNLYDHTAEITRFNNAGGLISQYYIGQQIGEVWGYVFDRFYTVDDFVEGSLNANLTNGTLKDGVPQIQGINPNPGDILFKDLDEDGVISPGNSTLGEPGDRQIIGNNTMRYQYGINGSFEYKGFSLSFLLNGVMKRDRYLNNDLTNAYNYEFGTIYKHQLDYWTPDNTISQYPRLYTSGFRTANHTSNYRASTMTLLNSAYLRLQNVTLGYTFDDGLVSKWGLKNLRLFASTENLLTISKLPKGIDPATNAKSNGLGYPYMRSFSFGLNVNL